MASATYEIPVLSLKRERVEYAELCDDGEEPTAGTRACKVARVSPNYYSNVKLVSLFCEERAFNEHDAKFTLLNMDKLGGIQFLTQQGANALIKKTVAIARALVFDETVSQRIERCKHYQLKRNPTINQPEIIIEGCDKLTSMLKNNDIDVSTFAHATFKHLTRQIGKNNNLLFYGPPATGKTMLMESLVNLNYNFARLSGMPTKNSFFASLLHQNACFLKGTLLQLKSSLVPKWSLLAAGSPLCTEVGGEQIVKNCVVYTCVNAPPQGALAAHTTAFCFNKEVSEYVVFSVFVWLKLWSDFGLEI